VGLSLPYIPVNDAHLIALLSSKKPIKPGSQLIIQSPYSSLERDFYNSNPNNRFAEDTKRFEIVQVYL
jgi:hypothetical protein